MNHIPYTIGEYLEQHRWEQEYRQQKGKSCSHWAPVDPNVETLRNLLHERMLTGIKKYGVTTEREDLTTEQWLQHAIEEALDLAVYLQRIKKDLEKCQKKE